MIPGATVHSFFLLPRFDATWEELGCHLNTDGVTRCTCAEDLCNAPFQHVSRGDVAAETKSLCVLVMVSSLCYATQ